MPAEKKSTIKFHSWFGGVKCECGKFSFGNFHRTAFECPNCEKKYRMMILDEEDQPVETECTVGDV